MASDTKRKVRIDTSCINLWLSWSHLMFYEPWKDSTRARDEPSKLAAMAEFS